MERLLPWTPRGLWNISGAVGFARRSAATRETPQGASLRAFDDFALFGGDAVKLVNQFVNFAVGRGDFAVEL